MIKCDRCNRKVDRFYVIGHLPDCIRLGVSAPAEICVSCINEYRRQQKQRAIEGQADIEHMETMKNCGGY